MAGAETSGREVALQEAKAADKAGLRVAIVGGVSPDERDGFAHALRAPTVERAASMEPDLIFDLDAADSPEAYDAGLVERMADSIKEIAPAALDVARTQAPHASGEQLITFAAQWAETLGFPATMRWALEGAIRDEVTA